MKLQSFALQSKSNSKPKPSKNFANDSSSSQFESSKTPEFVSEFDPSRNPNSAPEKAIIPPKENEWRLHKKMKNLELPPLHSGNKPLDFELEDVDVVAANDAGASMSFGLNLRQNHGKIDDFKSSSNGGSSIDAIMNKQFKNDLEKLPEEQGFDEYDDVPVDGFGAALLARYGWREGRGIGKNARDDVKLTGLGFMADHPPPPVATNAAAPDDKIKMKNLELPSLHSGNKSVVFEKPVFLELKYNLVEGLNIRKRKIESSCSSNGGSSIDAIIINHFKRLRIYG